MEFGMYNVEYWAANWTEQFSQYGLSQTQGFYINKVTRNSGAEKLA
jgi:hypothetical protein